ncbi:hypothetical protein QP580_12555, partial [Prevotella bivia]|nr:hypothetical protein [Prevotella bivia]
DETNRYNDYMVKSQAAGTLALKPGTERTYVNDQGRNVWEGIVTFTTTRRRRPPLRSRSHR